MKLSTSFSIWLYSFIQYRMTQPETDVPQNNTSYRIIQIHIKLMQYALLNTCRCLFFSRSRSRSRPHLSISDRNGFISFDETCCGQSVMQVHLDQLPELQNKYKASSFFRLRLPRKCSIIRSLSHCMTSLFFIFIQMNSWHRVH